MNHLVYLPLIASLASLLCSCSTPTAMEKHAQTATNNTPVTVQDSKPIAFARIIFKIPQGTEIGAFYDGLARVRNATHRWQLGTFAGNDEFRIAASEELRNAGYRVLGAENLVFGEDKAAKARYQLGGTVNHLVFNTYGPLAGNFSEANITVEYQLMDTLKDDIIWSATAEGYGKQPGAASAGVVITAFRQSIRQLMSRNDFVSTLKPLSTVESTQRQHTDPITITLPKPTTLSSLPEHISTAMDSVIVIKVGQTYGSGFLISKDGYALTAAHVVSGVKDCVVRMKSGLELPAQVLRSDEAQDVALLKLDGGGHKPLPLLLNGLPPLGSDLFALGTPADEALTCSVTRGIVSGHRDIAGRKYIQTDASLNPGNSGGPLLNKDGYAVGIVSWKVVAKGMEGLAFGVPLEIVGDRLGVQWVQNATE